MSRTPNLQLPEFGAVGVPDGAELTLGMRRLDAVVQAAAISFATTPPGSAVLGDRHVVIAPATGDFFGQERRLAFLSQDGWQFFTPENGWKVAVGSPPVTYVYDSALAAWVVDVPTTETIRMLGATWVKGSGAIEAPTFDVPIRCPFAGEVVGITVTTIGGPGNAVIDVWRDATYPLSDADSICGSPLPTLSADIAYEDTVLAGWDTAVNADDWFVFHLASSASFSMIVVQLFIRETTT